MIGASTPIQRRCDFVKPWFEGREKLRLASMIAPRGSPAVPFLRAATLAVAERAVHLRAMERVSNTARCEGRLV